MASWPVHNRETAAPNVRLQTDHPAGRAYPWQASDLVRSLVAALRGRRKSRMSNPWLKKNPFMSMWLSAANRMAASVRGQASAQATRQIKAALAKAEKDTSKSLTATAQPASPKAKRR